jgi:hypothetical protein
LNQGETAASPGLPFFENGAPGEKQKQGVSRGRKQIQRRNIRLKSRII